jgi:hypothetical protein
MHDVGRFELVQRFRPGILFDDVPAAQIFLEGFRLDLLAAVAPGFLADVQPLPDGFAYRYRTG